MKRLLSLAMAVVIAFSMTACSSGGTAQPTETPQPAEVPPEEFVLERGQLSADGTKFTNETMGVYIELPKGWITHEDERIAANHDGDVLDSFGKKAAEATESYSVDLVAIGPEAEELKVSYENMYITGEHERTLEDYVNEFMDEVSEGGFYTSINNKGLQTNEYGKEFYHIELISDAIGIGLVQEIQVSKTGPYIVAIQKLSFYDDSFKPVRSTLSADGTKFVNEATGMKISLPKNCKIWTDEEIVEISGEDAIIFDKAKRQSKKGAYYDFQFRDKSTLSVMQCIYLDQSAYSTYYTAEEYVEGVAEGYGYQAVADSGFITINDMEFYYKSVWGRRGGYDTVFYIMATELDDYILSYNYISLSGETLQDFIEILGGTLPQEDIKPVYTRSVLSDDGKYIVNESTNSKLAVPDGWHVATDEELRNYYNEDFVFDEVYQADIDSETVPRWIADAFIIDNAVTNDYITVFYEHIEYSDIISSDMQGYEDKLFGKFESENSSYTVIDKGEITTESGLMHYYYIAEIKEGSDVYYSYNLLRNVKKRVQNIELITEDADKLDYLINLIL